MTPDKSDDNQDTGNQRPEAEPPTAQDVSPPAENSTPFEEPELDHFYGSDDYGDSRGDK